MRHSIPPSFLLLGALVAACGNPPTVAAPPAFDRPESVSFFCWDRDASVVVPLGMCAATEDPAAGLPPSPFELHGVVTQTTTGEVGAVQITGDTDHPAGPIDSDIRVPGYTFAPVGAVPTAVVTPSEDPSYTYVISQGSASLHVIETASFRGGLGAMVTEMPEDDAGRPFFGVGSRPSSMELTPDEDALVVTIPERFEEMDGVWTQQPGEVWIVPIDGAEVGTPVRIPLATDVPPAVDLTALPEDELPPDYELVCDFDTIEPELAAPRAPVSAGAAPAPVAVAIDEERNRAIVSDNALPVLHVIDLETRAEVETINVGVPTREVVITPRVPSTLTGTSATERFLYAIDDTDDSVLAVDYGDPARASYGAVLTTSARGPRDRLEVPLDAATIEVVTPGYDAGNITFCTDVSDVDPSSLHGVFLAVATSDGFVRIYDVFDLDVTCRGSRECNPAERPGDADDVRVAIGRHRPRLATFLRSDDGVTVSDGPSWDVGEIEAAVNDMGTGALGVPALTTLTCPDGLAPVFPSSGDARVCAVTDPWIATTESYRFAWEGTVPFTATTGGNFVEGADAIEVRFDPCELGVLGATDVPASGELSSYAGDVIAITGPLPPSLSEEDQAFCEDLVDETTTGETTPILLRITSASSDPDGARDTYPGRLEVAPIDVPLDDVRRCFPELLQLEVRASGAFLVTSTRAGLRSPGVRGADGTCEVDPAALARGERGRAFPGELFATPDIAIRFDEGAPTVERPALDLTVGDQPVRLGFDIGFDSGNNANLTTLLVELEFNEVDERLYVVDQARRGLVRLDLTDPSAPFEAIFR